MSQKRTRNVRRRRNDGLDDVPSRVDRGDGKAIGSVGEEAANDEAGLGETNCSAVIGQHKGARAHGDRNGKGNVLGSIHNLPVERDRHGRLARPLQIGNVAARRNRN